MAAAPATAAAGLLRPARASPRKDWARLSAADGGAFCAALPASSSSSACSSSCSADAAIVGVEEELVLSVRTDVAEVEEWLPTSACCVVLGVAPWQRLLLQCLYSCTSKVSKLSTWSWANGQLPSLSLPCSHVCAGMVVEVLRRFIGMRASRNDFASGEEGGEGDRVGEVGAGLSCSR